MISRHGSQQLRTASTALVGLTVVLLAASAVFDLVLAGTGSLVLISGFLLVLIHGTLTLGGRNTAAFVVITVAVSFTAEAVGVATGVVFGDYRYTSELGPKILGVPPLVQVAYVAMAYASLVTARTILGLHGRVTGWRIAAVAFAGAIPMVGWDVAMDPHQSTVLGDWIWEDGGAYFGVPLHNYVGWFATVFAFLALYGLWESRSAPHAPRIPVTRLLRAEPTLYYAILGLGVVLAPVLGHEPATLAVPGNYAGTIEELGVSMSIAGAFTMGGPVAFALLRLFSDPQPSPD